MTIQDILPIIIPLVLIQFCMQAYYIRHCWKNRALTRRRRIVYIIMIAVFNLPAVAVYFFFAGKKKQKTRMQAADDIEIEDENRQGIFVLLIITYEIISLSIIYGNIGRRYYSAIIGFLAASFVMLVVNELFIRNRYRRLYAAIPVAEILLVLLIYSLDVLSSSQFLVLTVVASVVNGYTLRYAKRYAIGAFCLYIVCIVFKILNSEAGFVAEKLISVLYMNALLYILAYAAFYAIKKQILQNHLLQQAYRALHRQSMKLEEMAAIAERNRIAGEIHDNVGHMLTTAIVSIEAGEELVGKDNAAARDMLTRARGQIRDGLRSIRESVHAVKRGQKSGSFPERLQQLLADVRRSTPLGISDVVHIQSKLLPIQQRVLLQAVKECITNSLKHGESKQIDILIEEFRDNVQMAISDDGTGTDHIEFGAGLTFMRERVESIGGTLQVLSEEGQGFTVCIAIPMGFSGGRSNE